MATNHTENYNLNLWEPTDKFVREEFNENSEKIDVALGGMLGKPELLQEVSLRPYVSQFTIDMSEIDWSEWTFLVVIVHAEHSMQPKEGSLVFSICELNVRTDNKDDHALVLYTGRSDAGPIRAFGLPTGSCVYKEAPYSGITQIDISITDLGVAHGVPKAWIYGLK